MKTIGIVGSRRRDKERDWDALLVSFAREYNFGDRIVSGGCPEGADRMAEKIAKNQGITITIHYPRLEDLDQKLIGEGSNRQMIRLAWTKIFYARNTLIAEDCDVLIALVAEDRKGGTEDAVKKALKLKKRVILV